MRFSRASVGGLVGVVLALVGPGGLAVGYFSHPTQRASHPYALRLDGGAGDFAYAWDFVHSEGQRIWIDVWAYRTLADGSVEATGTTAASADRQPAETYVSVSIFRCDQRGCRDRSYTATSATNPTVRFALHPLLKTATIEATIRGHEIRATLSATGSARVGRYDFTYGRVRPPVVYEDLWVGLHALMTLDEVSIGDETFVLPYPTSGAASRGADVHACAAIKTFGC